MQQTRLVLSETLTISKRASSAQHADAQKLFPRNPSREQLAGIGWNADAASAFPESAFLDDVHTMPGLCEGQRDGESSESYESIRCQVLRGHVLRQ